MDIKVKFVSEDWENKIQLYENVGSTGNNKYYARTQAGWYTVGDAPYGFYDISSFINSQVKFIILDNKNNICFEENNDGVKKYLFLSDKCVKEGESIRDTYPLVKREGFKTWICSFMDLEKYTDFSNSMSPCVYSDNWSYSSKEMLSTKIIKFFDYQGIPYAISKILCKHQVCGVKWYDYEIRNASEEYCIYYYCGWEKCMED